MGKQPTCGLYLINNSLDFLESLIRKYFEAEKLLSISDVVRLLRNKKSFCIVVGCRRLVEEDVLEISKLCAVSQPIPCLFYGRLKSPITGFRLAKAGILEILPYGEQDSLIRKLQRLQQKATFEIMPAHVGISLNRCSMWTRKFINLMLENHAFLKAQKISEIAGLLGISIWHLEHVVKNDCALTPKQLQLYLRNYYAAHLLKNTHWSLKEIAYECGFTTEFDFYKSFKNTTGMTAKAFRKDVDWRDYPALYIKNMESFGQE